MLKLCSANTWIMWGAPLGRPLKERLFIYKGMVMDRRTSQPRYVFKKKLAPGTIVVYSLEDLVRAAPVFKPFLLSTEVI